MLRRVFSVVVAVVGLAGFVGAQAAQGTQPKFPPPADIQMIHIALLYRGPAYTATATPETQKLQEAHLAHLTKLAKEGSALIAGPISGGGDLAGIVMLKAATPDAAKALEAEDPAVKAGRLRIEMVSYMSPGNWFSFGPVKDGMPMRSFVFGFLKMKPGAPPLSAAATDAHLATLWAMRQAGTLIAAGPAFAAGDRAGVFVLNVDTLEKARALFADEPTVKNGTFTMEMYRWSAADGIMKGK